MHINVKARFYIHAFSNQRWAPANEFRDVDGTVKTPMRRIYIHEFLNAITKLCFHACCTAHWHDIRKCVFFLERSGSEMCVTVYRKCKCWWRCGVVHARKITPLRWSRSATWLRWHRLIDTRWLHRLARCKHKSAIPMTAHSCTSAVFDVFEMLMYISDWFLDAWLSVLWNCGLQPWKTSWIHGVSPWWSGRCCDRIQFHRRPLHIDLNVNFKKIR